ncbi:MaoC family dehydratase [Actinophytocola xanthii]|uniref:Enoyl-CoA hydratase n=1 Tax=Actinophytocola xanthii TaxID=1912961 RepID=A0A1Q8CW26_9PSEU|nr:MaoC family dehydratase [Actinophytocola xanthii]OLF18542.1 enoyl-CoA hydratase [Actinophytocola xanthii]
MTTVVNGLAELAALAGRELDPSDWHRISQERIDTFAAATGDHQWIHVDPERAATGPFGTTIAHGYLTLALLIPLWSQLLRIDGIRMAVNYGLNRVRLPAPVPAGGQVRLRARVAEVENLGVESVQTIVDFTMELRDAPKPALVAEAVYRYYA